ncbi:MAG: acetylxylan esterase [Verrucomicrobiales bacterium]|nr:acetylxylan esterase [Verrucomicrobiales bacterium]
MSVPFARRQFLKTTALLAPACHPAAWTALRADGTAPPVQDVRLLPLKDLDGYFPFRPPGSRPEWEQRAEQVRRQIQVALGLWPLPTRTPLNPVIHGRIDRGDYTVEKVYFESLPGFFVTGNLYRPARVSGKVPAVLFAHGHWKDARLSETTEAELRKEIASGAERFEEGGHSRFQSMCVQLARMGCVVWQWDMLGDSDCRQITSELNHGFSKQRPEMNTRENWGLFSPRAESHLQSTMGLQAWNAIRSVDFVLTLPEVDPDRIAVTGASGGGTQSMILAALDPRIALSFPAVMVSTAMQGGCTCENACLLRVDTGNVEFAALVAPRPQGMTTADDWTREMATKGFPELKKLYEQFGAGDRVMLHRGEHFPHNYNAVSRSAFYGWLNRHFHLNQTEPVIERDYVRLGRDQLTVWDDAHPAPKSGDPEFERRLLKGLTEDSSRQVSAAGQDPAAYRALCGPAAEAILGRTGARAGSVSWTQLTKNDRGPWWEMGGRLRNETHQEEVPVLFLHPKAWNGRTVLWLSDAGKTGILRDGNPIPAVRALLDAGNTVVGLDLLFQGETAPEGTPVTRTRRVKNPREAAAYTFGYNRALFAQRVHDVLTTLAFIRNYERPSKRILAVAVDPGTGPILAAALAVAGKSLDAAAVDTGGFRFADVADLQDVRFLPGGAKYGDIPGLLSLATVETLWLAGEPSAVGQQIQARCQSRVQIHEGAADAASAAAAWVIAVGEPAPAEKK